MGSPSQTRLSDLHFASPVEEGYYLAPSRRKEERLLALQQPSQRETANSANEKPPHFKLPVSSNGLFVYISPSQLPFLFYQRMILKLLGGIQQEAK